jgi:hypothetical protein
VRPFRLLGLPRKIGRGISLREIPLCGRLLRGPGFAVPHRCFAVVAFCSFRARMLASSFSTRFFCAKTGGRVPPLSDGGALTKSENIILCASSCHPPRSPYPHCTLPHVRFSGIGQKKKPQRKTAAAVNTLYMSCKKQA